MKLYAAYSLALDESTDISDTVHLVIFIGADTIGFDVVEEFSTWQAFPPQAQDRICEHMIRVLEKFELNPAKLCGLTTDGAPSMTGRTNGSKKF